MVPTGFCCRANDEELAACASVRIHDEVEGQVEYHNDVRCEVPILTISEWAQVSLDQLALDLIQDPLVHSRYGVDAARLITENVKSLRHRAERTDVYPNPRYNGHGEFTAGIIVLAMEFPQHYALLMRAVTDRPIRTFDGVLELSSLLNSISDDHDYILVHASAGDPQLFHESSYPVEHGFTPLTCVRDLNACVKTLLQRVGFDLACSTSPQP